MNKNIHNYVLFYTIFLLIGCGDSAGDYSRSNYVKSDTLMAMRFNDKAVGLLQEYKIYSGDHEDIDSALIYINKAIRLNRDYALAYNNKVAILLEKKRYVDAISILDTFLELKPRNINALMMQGFCYEKMNEDKKAIGKYREALRKCNSLLRDDSNNEYLLAQRAFVYVFLKSKDYALNEIDRLKYQYPDYKEINRMEKVIRDIDRKAVITPDQKTN
ncbi:MAG: hypothetical protein ACQETE_07895 [Bacteroidota bacterium]